MFKIYVEDGIEYTASNHRMKYNPEFHENHGNPFTVKELAYMCSMWDREFTTAQRKRVGKPVID